MSAADRNENREIIPRWRDLAATALHRELATTSDPRVQIPEIPAGHGEVLARRAIEFDAAPSLSFAADLLAASLVLGPVPQTIDAARIVLEDGRSSDMVRATARSVVAAAEGQAAEVAAPTIEDPEHERRAIRHLRHGLRGNPRNAIRWAELARHYTNEGHLRKAISSMRLAVSVSPQDRYIVRCAVRLWIHNEDPEQALRVLNQSKANVLADPWLLASELATSAVAGRSSRHIKRARALVDAGGHHPFALSELASALGTLELHAGDRRRARRLFNKALIDPNENSVAQAEWASRHVAGLQLDAEQVGRSPEARAIDSAETDSIDATLSAAWDWLIDQPFSSHPATFGSYQASKFQRFEDGERFAAHGLRANPHDWLLHNNRAFCLASMDRCQEASAALREAEHVATAGDRLTIQATWGLIHFRSGNLTEGRRLYQQAIDGMKDPTQQLRAQIMLVSEEARAGTSGMVESVQSLVDAIMDASNRDLRQWVAFIPRNSRT